MSFEHPLGFPSVQKYGDTIHFSSLSFLEQVITIDRHYCLRAKLWASLAVYTLFCNVLTHASVINSELLPPAEQELSYWWFGLETTGGLSTPLLTPNQQQGWQRHYQVLARSLFTHEKRTMIGKVLLTTHNHYTRPSFAIGLRSEGDAYEMVVGHSETQLRYMRSSSDAAFSFGLSKKSEEPVKLVTTMQKTIGSAVLSFTFGRAFNGERKPQLGLQFYWSKNRFTDRKVCRSTNLKQKVMMAVLNKTRMQVNNKYLTYDAGYHVGDPNANMILKRAVAMAKWENDMDRGIDPQNQWRDELDQKDADEYNAELSRRNAAIARMKTELQRRRKINLETEQEVEEKIAARFHSPLKNKPETSSK